MFKMVLFVGEIAPHGEKLLQALSAKGFHCSRAKLADEVDQAGKQLGKAILIFTDHNFAYRFLSSNRWPDFPILNLLYLHAPAKIKPEVQKKLDRIQLKVFDVTIYNKILERIEGFMQNPNNNEKDIDIEFLVNTDIGESDD